MRISREWLEAFVDVGDVSTETLVARLAEAGLPVEAVEQVGDDTVLDVEITANRPDCMSHVGVAREVALLFGRPLRLPDGDSVLRVRRAVRVARGRAPVARDVVAHAVGPAPPRRASVTVEDPHGCPRFTVTVLDGVRVGPSPEWMRRRLEAAGVRAIANVVDVTNYVMLEMGQPMHAFDYDRVGGHRLVIRRARLGERLRTLDGVERVLDADTLVVADDRHAVSLAGIIGGSDTEIGPHTRTVLLEAAYWDPPTLGRTARRLGVRTEASARFERGADPEGPARAQARAGLLLAEVAGGRVLPGAVDVYPRPRRPRPIRLRPARAAAVLGLEIPRARMVRALRALGCRVEGGERTLTVTPPTYRPDLAREEDLIEEVARVAGYDKIPLTLPRGITPVGVTSPRLAAGRRIRQVLVGCGLSEVVTLTLVTAEEAALGGPPAGDAAPGDAAAGGARPVRLQNPLTAEHVALRTSLLPGLLRVLATNASRRTTDVHVFEQGHVWTAGEGGTPVEREALGLAVMGRWRTGWNVPEETALADLFHLRGVLDALFEDLRVPRVEVRAAPERDAPPIVIRSAAGAGDGSGDGALPLWHPGRAAEVVVGGRAVGRFGEVHPGLAARERLPHRAYLAELDVEAVLGAARGEAVFEGVPRHPEVERDLAAVAPDDVPAAQIDAIIRRAGGPLLVAVDLFDVYAGPPVPPGHRNLAYRLRFRAADRTLTAEEAEEILARIRTALRERAGAQIRE